MPFQKIAEHVAATNRFEALRSACSYGPSGAWGLAASGRWLTLSALMLPGFSGDRLETPILVLTSDDESAEAAARDIAAYTGNSKKIDVFPSWGVAPYEGVSPERSTMARRMEVLHSLLAGEAGVVVSSIDAACQRVIPSEELIERVVLLRSGEEKDPMVLEEAFSDMGYERVESVDDCDQFTRRGGIVDIFPSTSDRPVRIEFFGDEIEAMRYFDPDTQKSVGELKELEIVPCREVILSRRLAAKAMEKVREAALKRKLLSSVEKVNTVLERMGSGIYFQGIESFLPYFYDRFETIFDYFGKRAVIAIDEPSRILDRAERVFKQMGRLYTGDVFDNSILPGPDAYLLNASNLKKNLEKTRYLSLTALKPSDEFLAPPGDSLVELPFRSLPSAPDRFDILLDEMASMVEAGMSVLVCLKGHGKAERLAEMLQERGVASSPASRPDPSVPGVWIFEGELSQGFEASFADMAVVAESDVFKAPRKKKTVTRAGTFLTRFAEISLGDYVVHVDHGIGVYEGIVLRETEGEEKDFISVRYAAGDRLYVPLEQAIKVQKYLGDEGYAPSIDKLSSARWDNVKRSAKRKLKEMAKELIELYARRMTRVGYRFAPDTMWQYELEAAFPFEETDDQLKAIEDVKLDMESSKPMDRLICGDVGYGKTEVATRAAFKAVQNAKQVAVLVPTTILAQQHFKTFRDRFSKFDVKVELLSRLRTPNDVKTAKKGLKDGTVDVVVGTHMLLGNEVRFKDLGLLVVDEEQRFGVTHKEKIKELRHEVDCITLTATPIPRTLQFSLSGVRDMSIINTPPVDRLAIRTFVVPYEEDVVVKAMRRELSREGQAYFVYNKVENIDNFATYVRSMVPDARVAVGHGQMDKRLLEKIMIDFLDYKYDILVCSTIIESGLDIPNANTIFVYDAQNFGLTQLYQLRGRVGRERTQAYAYFFYRKDQVLTETADKRLKTIEEFTELGSGFKIALKDLEIRGAGALLGTAQHGFMRTIGFELYCQLMERAVKELKGEIPEDSEELDVVLNLGLEAHLPGEYIADVREKMTLYKRLSSTLSEDEVESLKEEVADRFGSLPREGDLLFASRSLMLLMGRVGATTMKIVKTLRGPDKVRIRFSSEKRLSAMKIVDIADRWGKAIQFTTDSVPTVTVEIGNSYGMELIELMGRVLEEFKG